MPVFSSKMTLFGKAGLYTIIGMVSGFILAVLFIHQSSFHQSSFVVAIGIIAISLAALVGAGKRASP